MHVQNQAAWPTGNRAEFTHGPRGDRDAGFNFDSQVIAVAKEMLLHRLDYMSARQWLSLLKLLQSYPDPSRHDINRATPIRATPYQPCFATRLGGVSGGKVTQEWRVSPGRNADNRTEASYLKSVLLWFEEYLDRTGGACLPDGGASGTVLFGSDDARCTKSKRRNESIWT